MENLKAFAQIIKKINLKSSDLIISNRIKKTKADIFFDKIISNTLNSDTEAAQFFFNTTNSNSNYKNLKYSLKEKLLNTVFFFDPNKTKSDYEKAILYCCKNFYVAKILIHLGARSISTDLFIKVFNKAVKFELTEFIVMTSKILRVEYGSRLLNREKFHHYNNEYKEYKKIHEAESLAEEYYNLLVLPYGDSSAKKKETSQLADQFYQKLAPILKEYKSPYLHFIGNLIKIFSSLNRNDYNLTIAICESSIQFFENKPYNYRPPIRAFLHNQLICYTQVKNYQKGKTTALKSLKSVKNGTYSWYINKELHLILAFHSKEYSEANIILYEALNHRKFTALRSSFRERWLIHKAFIGFLIFIGKIPVSEILGKKFKLGKFLNSVPTHTKDKRGLNIPILIIQILFMIVKKDYDQSIDRFEAIQKYCSRYLRSGDNLRSNCFINMLIQIPISGFHKAGVKRRAKKYYDKLLATPLDIANQAHEIEIIPYEDLWEFVVESLETKFYKTKR